MCFLRTLLCMSKRTGGFSHLLSHFLFKDHTMLLSCIGAFLALAAAFLVLKYLTNLLPTDHGRAYAVEGIKSKGKPTSAGLLFITVFALFTLLFVPLKPEYIFYVVLIEAAMIFGYLDDKASKPWSEYRKGLLDLMISFLTALTFTLFNSTDIVFPILGFSFTMPAPVYLLFGTVLVWVAINVTNCTDGVDGLSSTLTILSIAAMTVLSALLGTIGGFTGSGIIMIAVLIAYLWFNTNPSMLLMGDAGSRALGVFMAILAMQTHQPFAYLILCLVFILDGGAGIVKISLKRFLHISILKNTTTPFHDHFRKKIGWSNPQVTIRMSVLHLLLCSLYLLIVYVMLHR